jgi:hypothetical protein
MAPEPTSDKGKRIHRELRDLLEAAVVQQAQSSVERRHPEASVVTISTARSAPKGHHAPTILQPEKGQSGAHVGALPSARPFVMNRDAHPTQGARRGEPNLANIDHQHYGDSDPDNHGRHPKI